MVHVSRMTGKELKRVVRTLESMGVDRCPVADRFTVVDPEHVMAVEFSMTHGLLANPGTVSGRGIPLPHMKAAISELKVSEDVVVSTWNETVEFKSSTMCEDASYNFKDTAERRDLDRLEDSWADKVSTYVLITKKGQIGLRKYLKAVDRRASVVRLSSFRDETSIQVLDLGGEPLAEPLAMEFFTQPVKPGTDGLARAVYSVDYLRRLLDDETEDIHLGYGVDTPLFYRNEGVGLAVRACVCPRIAEE